MSDQQETPPTFAEWLRAARARLGYSQSEFSYRVYSVGGRIAANQISEYERGILEPGYRNLVSICKVVGDVPPEFRAIGASAPDPDEAG